MSFASSLMPSPEGDVGRKAFQMRKMIKELQESLTVIEKCPQPVIAAVHSACVGGGVDMICACDIRMSTDDAWFQIKVLSFFSIFNEYSLYRNRFIIKFECIPCFILGS